jgi:hypothetical protein
MAQPWFRMYAEFCTDPKIQFLSEALQRRYVFALCVTCNGELEKVTDEELAFAMRITPEEWAETKKVFIEKGLFTAEGRVKNWEKRQYKSDVADPTNKERQQRYRNGKRNGGVTEEKRTDTDTDTEKDSIPFHDIVAAYNKFCPSLPKVHHINLGPERISLIKAAWFKYKTCEGGPLPIFDKLFKKAEGSGFLTSRRPGYNGDFFKAKFDWIFHDKHMPKILEGDYDDPPEPPKKKKEVAF